MPGSCICNLGNVHIELIPDKLNGAYAAIGKFENFFVTDSPDISLNIHFGSIPNITDLDKVFEARNFTWQISSNGVFDVIKVISPEQDPYQLGVFSKDYRSGNIYLPESLFGQDSYVFPLSYPLGELFMMNLLGTGLGMLCHASGILYKGDGYLFIGHGHDGKTTTSRLWAQYPGVKVVNDDKVILRKEGTGIRMYGTPWHGEGGWAFPDSAPLKRVLILKKAPTNALRLLSTAEAVGMMFARSFLPLWDSSKVAHSLNFLDDLCRSVPVQEFSFLPETSAVEYIQNSN